MLNVQIFCRTIIFSLLNVLHFSFKGVGGIEAEAVMLGQAISMVLPQVVGYKLVGKLSSLVTSTDVVLTITKVSIKFYEWFLLLCRLSF